MRFHVLGVVSAVSADQPVDLGHARVRCVLSILLIDANRFVPVDQLMERIWDDQPPRRGRSVLYSYMSRLRSALSTEHGVTIEQRSGSYMLVVDSESVDLHRFRDLIKQARATPDDVRALELFDQALGLWRGTPFADLDTPWLASVRTALEVERQAAQLDRTDVALRCGHDAELLADLRNSAAQQPFDERIAGQLMCALAGTGRHADALAAYQQTRQVLVDQLGLEPGPELRRLHERILAGDTAIVRPAPPAPVVHGESHEAPLATEHIGDQEAGPHARHTVPTPQQLPPAPASFVGRVRELGVVTEFRTTTAAQSLAITVLTGAGGVGKTWLALQWAYQHMDQFPDGQLFADLRGFTPAERPTPVEALVRGLLDSLGVSGDSMPASLDAQVGRYRSLVAGKRMLIILDNARDTAQVTPLLPGSPTCTVLITSRDRLTGLTTGYGARSVAVDLMSACEALALLSTRLGQERAQAEPDAVAEIARHCNRYPLALSVAAGRANAHPDFPLAVVADDLRDGTRRLRVLDDGESAASVAVALSCSYDILPAEQARTFGLLAIAPGVDISLAATAALTGVPPDAAETTLRALERVSLVQQDRPGRWRMHDLTRLFATERAVDDLSDAERDLALRRLTDFYLRTACDASLDPLQRANPIDIDHLVPTGRPQPLPDNAAALAWLEAEHSNLLAVQQTAMQRGWHATAWQLAWALRGFHMFRGHITAHIAVSRTALAAATQANDMRGQAMAHQYLGWAHTQLDHGTAALHHLNTALALARTCGDRAREADVHMCLSIVWEEAGENIQALNHAMRHLELRRSVRDETGEADALNSLGWHATLLGEYESARVWLETALELQRRHHNVRGEAETLDSLGYLAHSVGELAEAVDCYQDALAIYRGTGNSRQEAHTLEHLGATYAQLGKVDLARAAWHHALELFDEQNRTKSAVRIKHQLGSLDDQHEIRS